MSTTATAMWLILSAWQSGVWQDEMTDEQTPYAFIENSEYRLLVSAADAYSRQMTLTSTRYFDPGMETATLRVDDHPVITYRIADWYPNKLVMFLPADHPLLSQMRQGSTLLLRTTLNNGTMHTFRIPLAGSAQALSPLIPAKP